MTDRKVDELPDGGALQDDDQLYANRGGTDVHIRGSAVGGSGGGLPPYLYVGNGFSGPLDLTGETDLLQVIGDNGSNFSTLILAGCSNLNYAKFDASQATTLTVTGCTSLLRLDVRIADDMVAAYASVDLSDCTLLQQLTLTRNPTIVAHDLTGLNALTTLTLSSCVNLASVTLASFEDLLDVTFNGCALTESVVDAILVALDANGLSNGSVDLGDGTNAPPSAPGLAAKASLEGKGWSVTVNV